MKIETSNPLSRIWSAIDADTYDGAEDSNCPIGNGTTEREAINALVEQLLEDAHGKGYDAAEKEAHRIKELA